MNGSEDRSSSGSDELRDGPAETDAAAWSTSVSAALRATREQRGWSLRDAADRSCGFVRPSTLGSYERGDRQLTVIALHRLADLYDVPVRALLPPDPKSTDQTDRILQTIERLNERQRTLVQTIADELQP